MTLPARSWLIPLRFVGMLWLIRATETVLHVSVAGLGVYPRTLFGLVGVVFAPLIHGDWMHLVSNSVPLLVLGTALFLLYPGVAYTVFGLSYFLTGTLVWVFGRPSLHIGASGLLYGIAFFLMTIGLFRKDAKSVAVSLVVAFFYSGIIFGVLPVFPGVSWESHLLGALVGVGCAARYSRSLALPPGPPGWRRME